jgi:23S rRNA maturation mini-RNase III
VQAKEVAQKKEKAKILKVARDAEANGEQKARAKRGRPVGSKTRSVSPTRAFYQMSPK